MTLDPEQVLEAGRTIRSARGKRTARDVASQAGVSERRYRDLERGYTTTRDGARRPVRADVNEYTSIASALGLDPNDLLDTLGVDHTPGTAMPNVTTFGTYLHQRRTTTLNGLSLRDVAAGSGLSHVTLHMYESSRSLPSEESLPKVAKAYRVKLADLRDVYQAALQSRVELTLPQKYGELSRESYRALLAHADLLLSLQKRDQGTQRE